MSRLKDPSLGSVPHGTNGTGDEGSWVLGDDKIARMLFLLSVRPSRTRGIEK